MKSDFSAKLSFPTACTQAVPPALTNLFTWMDKPLVITKKLS